MWDPQWVIQVHMSLWDLNKLEKVQGDLSISNKHKLSNWKLVWTQKMGQILGDDLGGVHNV